MCYRRTLESAKRHNEAAFRGASLSIENVYIASKKTPKIKHQKPLRNQVFSSSSFAHHIRHVHTSNAASLIYLSLRLKPLSQFHLLKMQYQSRPIQPGQVREAAGMSLVYDARNPENCECGWYCFYGNCSHMYHQYPITCGRRITPSGKSGFCRSPAPQHVVRGYYVNASCADCRRYGF